VKQDCGEISQHQDRSNQNAEDNQHDEWPVAKILQLPGWPRGYRRSRLFAQTLIHSPDSRSSARMHNSIAHPPGRQNSAFHSLPRNLREKLPGETDWLALGDLAKLGRIAIIPEKR
jgi:hypothetical protein